MSRGILFFVFLVSMGFQSAWADMSYYENCDASNPKYSRIFYSFLPNKDHAAVVGITIVGDVAKPLTQVYRTWWRQHYDKNGVWDATIPEIDFSCDYRNSCNFKISDDARVSDGGWTRNGDLDSIMALACKKNGILFYRFVFEDGDLTNDFLWKAVGGPGRTGNPITAMRNSVTCRDATVRKDWDITCWIDFDLSGHVIPK